MASKATPFTIVFQALDKISDPLREINKKLEATTAPVKRFQNQITRFGKATGITQIGDQLGKVGKGLVEVGNEAAKTLLKFIGFGAAAGFALDRLIRGTIDANGSLTEVAKKTGISVEKLQEWRFAAENSGGSIEDLDSGLTHFQKTLAQTRIGKGKLVELLGENSEFIQKIKGIKDTSKAFEFLIETASNIPDEANRQLFLESAAKGSENLLGLVALTKEQRAELFKTADANGLVSQAQAEGFNKAKDGINNLIRSFEYLKSQVVAPFLPLINDLIVLFQKAFNDNLPAIQAWAQSLASSLPSAQQITDAVSKLAVEIAPLIKSFIEWISVGENLKLFLEGVALVLAGPLLAAVAGLIASMVTLIALVAVSPFGWIAAAVAGIGAIVFLVVKLFDKLVELRDNVGNFFSLLFGAAEKKLGFAGAPANPQGGLSALSGMGIGAGAPVVGEGVQTPAAPQSQPQNGNASIKVEFANTPKGTRIMSSSDKNVDLGVEHGMSSMATGF